MDPLLQLIVTITLLVLFVGVLFWALRKTTIPEPLSTIIIVVMALIILVYLSQRFGLL